jgi:tRNA(Ile)-lysidine synthase
VRQEPSFRVLALHVHHGLSPQADAWRDRLGRVCRRWRRGAAADLRFVPLHVKVDPRSSAGLEAEARQRRYEALTRAAHSEGARVVLLAHHRDDQTETVLLQALRGAGPAGLSAMPRQIERDGLLWIRPWLGRPRSAIEAYLHRYRLNPVEDESNLDPRFSRNRLRHQVVPAVRASFPEVDTAMAAVARHAQDAAACLDELARMDLARCRGQGPDRLSQEALQGLSGARLRNLLRVWLGQVHQISVTEPLLSRLSQELVMDSGSGVGQRRWQLGPARWLELHRRQLGIFRASGDSGQTSPGSHTLETLAEGSHQLPGWASGTLEISRALPGEPGIRVDRLHALGPLRLVCRQPAMQFQLTSRSMPRALVKQFQARDVALPVRSGPYLLTVADELLFAPGLGLDGRFHDEESPGAAPGKSGVRLKIRWLLKDCVG